MRFEELPAELRFDRPDDAARYRKAVPGYMKRIRDLYEAIQDRFGEEGLQLIREVSRSYGERIAANLKKGGEVRGVPAVGRYLLRVFDIVGGDWEVSEYSEDRMIIEVGECPYPFTREATCAAHTCMEQALVTSLDPELTYRIGCSIPKGDARCEHVLERRSPHS